MSYEDQLIREATGEGLPSFQEAHEDYFSDETLEAEDRDVTNETGDQQGETTKCDHNEMVRDPVGKHGYWMCAKCFRPYQQ